MQHEADRMSALAQAMSRFPALAILRGLKADTAAAVGEILVDAGFHAIEVPLQSSEAADALKTLVKTLGDRACVGAGTILDRAGVAIAADAGARFIVSPDTNPDVIEAALAASIETAPGFMTPSEGLQAIRHGARMLKLFPAARLGTDYLRDIKVVLPSNVSILAVGGVGADNLADWLNAGAIGLGIGSALFRPEDTFEGIEAKAQSISKAIIAAAPVDVRRQEGCQRD
jgi:2-dehydro-3-deoxyphosphogalactonate aldolase